MAAVTSLGSIFDTNDGTKTVTATPAVGDLIVIVTGQSGNATDTAPTDNNADGLGTYTAIQNRSRSAGTARLGIFVRNALIGSATSTIFSHAPGTTTGGGLYVLKATGMSRFGTSAVRGSGGQDNGGGGGTPAPVLTQAGLATNPVITAVQNATNPAGVTVPASFSDHGNLGYLVPTTGNRAASRDSGNTSQTITWGGTSASTFASGALELDTSAVVTGAATLSGTGTLSATGIIVFDGTAALTGTGTLSAEGVRGAEGSAALVGSGTASATGSLIVEATAALVGVGALSSSGERTAEGAAALTGTGSSQTTGTILIQGFAALTGVGSLSAGGIIGDVPNREWSLDLPSAKWQAEDPEQKWHLLDARY